MVSNLALFCLATYLATFQKIGQFFLNHLVTLIQNEMLWAENADQNAFIIPCHTF